MDKEQRFEAQHFGPFLPFVMNEKVTDITWNGKMLWIDDITRGRYRVTDKEILEGMTEEFVEDFSRRVADFAGVSFNPYTPRLEAQIDIFRLSIIHKANAHTGTSIAIRRTSTVCQLKEDECIANGYCSKEVWDFLPKIIRAGFSCIAGGLPGVGKTELLKLLSTYIPPYDRAIVMEDSPEFHYAIINPESDCTEWQITEHFPYPVALEASLRQRPVWNILAEARGRETQFLMENFSSGIRVLTSTHLDKEEDLIPRLRNMIGDPIAAQSIENEVYLRNLVVFVIQREIGERITRRLSQICFYSRENGVNTRTLVMDNGEIVCRELPETVMRQFRLAGYDDPLNAKENQGQ